jgi:hypothetical protein
VTNPICAQCGQPVDGYASINDDWYCHPDDEDKPDCYSLAGWEREVQVDEDMAAGHFTIHSDFTAFVAALKTTTDERSPRD